MAAVAATEPIETYGADEIGELSQTFDAMLEKIHGGLRSGHEDREGRTEGEHGSSW